MFDFRQISRNVLAAVSSLAISALFFAMAIAPANQGAVLPGMIA